MSNTLPVECQAETCESCGREFSCGAKRQGCWCAELKLSDATRAQLAGRFRGCLCRACLVRLAAREAGEAGGANLSDAV
jgi:Cysteine-rich CWC